ncbi:MAG: hypothetical protein WA159_17305 [Variovorax sp.]
MSHLQSDAQVFAQLRDRAAKAGHTLTRSSEPGGTAYLATCWGMCRRFERLDQLTIFVDLVTGALDARVAAFRQERSAQA